MRPTSGFIQHREEEEMLDQEVIIPEGTPKDKIEKAKESILYSRKKYQEAKQKQDKAKEKRKLLKQQAHLGRQFLDENKENIIGGRFTFRDKFEIAYVAMKLKDQSTAAKGFVDCQFTYAIKSPTDTWNGSTARGLCGHRLSCENDWRFPLSVPEIHFDSNKEAVLSAIQSIISSRMILQSPEVPQRVTNTVFGHLKKRFRNKDKIEDLMLEALSCIERNDFEGSIKASTKALKLGGATDKEAKDIAKVTDLARALSKVQSSKVL
jgi:hypothetical protein